MKKFVNNSIIIKINILVAKKKINQKSMIYRINLLESKNKFLCHEMIFISKIENYYYFLK
jgi:hypothetical protein